MANDLFIKNNIQKVIRGEYTDFLDPLEYQTVKNYLQKRHLSYEVFSPFEGCEKKIIYVTFPQISVLKLSSNQPLKHNEILGTLFQHNIAPNKYGDIIANNPSYLIVLESIKKYLLFNLTMIGKQKVNIIECSLTAIKDYHFTYEEFTILVNSLRLDNVVAAITRLSRKEVDELINIRYVLVNYTIKQKKTYFLKENDIISIRKSGKYCFKEIIKKTNKDKYLLKLWKYK